jgi:hypothetical protein
MPRLRLVARVVPRQVGRVIRRRAEVVVGVELFFFRFGEHKASVFLNKIRTPVEKQWHGKNQV